MVHWENDNVLKISTNVRTAPLKIGIKSESNLATKSSYTWEVTHNLGSVRFYRAFSQFNTLTSGKMRENWR